MSTPADKTEEPVLGIPIPVPLPTPLRIHQRKKIDDLDSVFSDMIIDDSKRNVHFGDKDNYFLHTPYNQEIIKNLQAKEMKYVFSPSFLSARGGINPQWRRILVDWLIEICEYFDKLDYSTLYLTVKLIDRFMALQFLALHPIANSKLWLLGLTCLLIAAKMHGTCTPSIAQRIFQALNNFSFSKSDFLGMEVIILNELKFKIHMPTPMDFMDPFLFCVPNHELMEKEGENVKTMCMQVLDESLMDIECVQWSASTITAAAVMVAVDVIGERCTKFGDRKEDFTVSDELLLYYTNHTKENLMPCVQRLTRLMCSGNQQ